MTTDPYIAAYSEAIASQGPGAVARMLVNQTAPADVLEGARRFTRQQMEKATDLFHQARAAESQAVAADPFRGL